MLSQALPPFPTQLFINNQYIDSHSPNRLSVTNPYDGTSIPHTAHIATKEDIDAAVSAAQTAYKTTWAKLSPREKQACMLRFADLVEKNAERLAILESLPTGKPVTPTIQFDIAHMVDVYRYYAGWTDKLAGESYPASNGVYKIVRHEPLGVCAGIASWNATFMYIGWKIAPAVAAGNCFIFKPSEKSPFGALALGALFAEAGFPPGVVQILNGAQETGALLASHPNIAKISFTGSLGGGRAVQDSASKSNLKKSYAGVRREESRDCLWGCGLSEGCGGCLWIPIQLGTGLPTSRVLVHKSIFDKFTAAIKQAFEEASATLGANPLDKSTIYGPVVDKLQFDKIMSYIAIGKETATLLTGGSQKGEKGFFIQPTIFVNPDPESPILKEEIFGPVVAIQSFETEEEALALANGTEYGLAASIYTSDLDRALRVSSQLECGGVAINSPFIPELNTPFGGVKASGQGRELGREGLLEYTEAKSIHIRLDMPKL
ncbi:hypothetical protein BDV12DRAFT_197752 [Aspergillus spectabilis]